jgi:hypothetical protein
MAKAQPLSDVTVAELDRDARRLHVAKGTAAQALPDFETEIRATEARLLTYDDAVRAAAMDPAALALVQAARGVDELFLRDAPARLEVLRLVEMQIRGKWGTAVNLWYSTLMAQHVGDFPRRWAQLQAEEATAREAFAQALADAEMPQ